jgi:hypothetical protein
MIAIGSAIFFAVIIAEMARAGGQIVYYRRPARWRRRPATRSARSASPMAK